MKYLNLQKKNLFLQLSFNTDKLVQKMRAFLTSERQRRRAANMEVSHLKQELAAAIEANNVLTKRNSDLDAQLKLSYHNLQLVECEQAVTADLLLRCERHCGGSASR